MTLDLDSKRGDQRAAIDDALDAGDAVTARASARALWESLPNASTARFLSSRFERLWPHGAIAEHRVAILRSFTVEPVVPLLQAEAVLSGCRLIPWIGEFNAYGQEILSPQSGLYSHRPDTVILAVQSRDVAPGLWANFGCLDDAAVEREIAAAVELLVGLVRRLRNQCDAQILVHGLDFPNRPERGMLDLRRAQTQFEAIGSVNRALRLGLAQIVDAHYFDYADLQARFGRLRFASEKKWATARLPLTVEALGCLAQEWWRHLHLFALPRSKVLAIDLDNTLWGGVVGEDGVSGIQLGDAVPGVYFKAFQQAVLEMRHRGILLAVVSKNNPDDAFEVFDHHPHMLIRREHLAAARINWSPKATNLAEIAQELGLGLDSFVFVDDNPAECDAVRRALPEVAVLELGADPSTFADALRNLPGLERIDVTTEDLERTRYYANERARQELLGATESLEDFLVSLHTTVSIEEIGEMTLARAAQLTQKTNQLNLTTRRYSEAQLAAWLKLPGQQGFILSASDRFGDHGIVGVALTATDGQTLLIDTFLLSCRVIGREIETAFLKRLADIARSAGCVRMVADFFPTAKNEPARMILPTAGFELQEETPSGRRYSLEFTERAVASPHWIKLAAPADQA